MRMQSRMSSLQMISSLEWILRVGMVMAPAFMPPRTSCAVCASVPPFSPEKLVFVTPDAVDRWPVTRDRLLDEIVLRLQKKLAEEKE